MGHEFPQLFSKTRRDPVAGRQIFRVGILWGGKSSPGADQGDQSTGTKRAGRLVSTRKHGE